MSDVSPVEAVGDRVGMALRNLAKLTDPVDVYRRQADLVRWYRDGGGQRSLDCEHLADETRWLLSWRLPGLLADRAELAELYASTDPIVRSTETAFMLASSALFGVADGMIGNAGMTLAIGGAAGLAALGTDDPDLRHAAHSLFKAAASILLYRVAAHSGRASQDAMASEEHG